MFLRRNPMEDQGKQLFNLGIAIVQYGARSRTGTLSCLIAWQVSIHRRRVLNKRFDLEMQNGFAFRQKPRRAPRSPEGGTDNFFRTRLSGIVAFLGLNGARKQEGNSTGRGVAARRRDYSQPRIVANVLRSERRQPASAIANDEDTLYGEFDFQNRYVSAR